ncbi:MAG TPA: hypothetical protein VFC17_05585 [Candidatus Limnocylindrales bacterium]|nr:hypothetical protein [Candidatus Limnocylindrales bacterium]
MFLLAAALLFGSGRLQKSLNHDRDTLGLTHAAVLENAPPMLAFTTVALGSFRGLISNFLWIRADDLQQDDKFFEAAQLADWITKLEPTFASVWVNRAWNMAYNISVKFKENAPGDYSDRWRWVEHGIELLRDEGLRYNPNSVDIYRELAWFFQNKLGANLDDGNMFYKIEWAREMTPFFGANGTNFSTLINPPDAAARTNAALLREKYQIDPAFAKSVDDKYGPLDWRLPEAHAIYWGALGLDAAGKNPGKVNADDLIKLRRIIYQSMLQAFHHGRIIADPFSKSYSLGPNLDLTPQVNAAYEQLYAEETDPSMKVGILRAHRNFLRDAVYFLYVNNRMAEANKWFKYLGEKYPDKPIIETQPDSLPKNLTLDEYAVAVVQIDIGETSQERVTTVVQGLLSRAYYNLATGEDDRYENLKRLAVRVYERYTAKTATSNRNVRTPLPPYDTLNNAVIRQLLDPESGVPYAARAVLRTQLGLPAETTAAPAGNVSSTNQPPAGVTNAVENGPTNSAAK